MSDTTELRWPKASDEGNDLSVPLKTLLTDLGLGTTEAAARDSANVIESTTLAVTKVVTGIIAGLGGVSVIAGVLGGWWAEGKEHPALAIGIVASVAFVLGASVLALARVMDGDVRGRSAVTTQQVEARGVVAAAFIEQVGSLIRTPERAAPAAGTTPATGATGATETTTAAAPDPAATAFAADLRAACAAFRPGLRVQTSAGWTEVTAVERTTEGLRIQAGGDIVGPDEVTGFAHLPRASS